MWVFTNGFHQKNMPSPLANTIAINIFYLTLNRIAIQYKNAEPGGSDHKWHSGRCLDDMSTHKMTTWDFDPHGRYIQCFVRCDITTAILWPCNNLLLQHFISVTFYNCEISSLYKFITATSCLCNVLLMWHFISVTFYFCDILSL